MRFLIITLFIVTFGIGLTQAQDVDSVRSEIKQVSVDSLNMQDSTNLPTDKKVKKRKKKEKEAEEKPYVYKDSTRLALEAMTKIAVRRSAIIPGWGQLTNKKWWKVPIIYGGVAGLIYSYDVAKSGYSEMLAEAQYRLANNNLPLNEKYAAADTQWIIQAKDFYRRNRDLTILLGVGLYALNLIDAYIDAKMFRYDISDDLTFKLNPTLDQPLNTFASRTPVFGLKMSITIH